MIERLVAAVTGPRGRWLTVGIWLVLGAGGLVARTQIGDVTAAGQASYLPAHASRRGHSRRCSATTKAATTCRR
jgi:hypothetical protein